MPIYTEGPAPEGAIAIQHTISGRASKLCDGATTGSECAAASATVKRMHEGMTCGWQQQIKKSFPPIPFGPFQCVLSTRSPYWFE